MYHRYGMSMDLGKELVNLNQTVINQELTIEELRIKAAMYKAAFFGEHDLYDKLRKQCDENYDARIGEYDGFCYSSRRANAVFRSLEDMYEDGLLTESEYDKCSLI